MALNKDCPEEVKDFTGMLASLIICVFVCLTAQLF